MNLIITGPTELLIEGLFGPRQADEHCRGYLWHKYISGYDKNYLADVARRQADKRAAGIGPEGRCPR
jgi:hypothetical protein